MKVDKHSPPLFCTCFGGLLRERALGEHDGVGNVMGLLRQRHVNNCLGLEIGNREHKFGKSGLVPGVLSQRICSMADVRVCLVSSCNERAPACCIVSI